MHARGTKFPYCHLSRDAFHYRRDQVICQLPDSAPLCHRQIEESSTGPVQVHGELMSIPNDGMERRPIHPGEMLREDFLPDYNLNASALAKAIGVSRQSIHELLRERRGVSPEMALRLARLFGNSPEFWINAQRAVDLWEAAEAGKSEIERIQPLQAV